MREGISVADLLSGKEAVSSSESWGELEGSWRGECSVGEAWRGDEYLGEPY